MKKKHLLTGIGFMSLLATLILFSSYEAFGIHPVWPGNKLKIIFPGAVSFEQKKLFILDEQEQRIEEMLGFQVRDEDLWPSIYLAVQRKTPDERPKKVAAIIFVKAKSEGGKIDLGVVVGRKGNLLRVHIFENNGHEVIVSTDFLEQFKGKKAGDLFQVGRDIVSPEKHKRSFQAIASGAKKGLVIINEMLSRG
jgi:hypothetical protein